MLQFYGRNGMEILLQLNMYIITIIRRISNSVWISFLSETSLSFQNVQLHKIVAYS